MMAVSMMPKSMVKPLVEMLGEGGVTFSSIIRRDGDAIRVMANYEWKCVSAMKP
jgi:hypothetical protein